MRENTPQHRQIRFRVRSGNAFPHEIHRVQVSRFGCALVFSLSSSEIAPLSPFYDVHTGLYCLMPNTYETIQVGDSYEWKKVVTAEDVKSFAQITGDDNPIHVDEEYAKEHSRFGRPVVHGVLLLGLISKVLGRDYPGHGSIAVAISCRFLRPVTVGSEVTVEIKVAEKLEASKHIKVKVYIYKDNKMVLGGEGRVIPPTEEDGELQMPEK